MLAECVAASKKPKVHGQIHGGGVYIFFTKLARLLSCPLSLVFVLDGPDRPKIKRGVKVNTTKRSNLENLIRNLVEIMGYHLHQVKPSTGYLL